MVDPRHSGIRLPAEEQIAARGFQNWSMSLAEHDETANFVFGPYGVTPEAGFSIQPANVLLDLAGELARQRA